MSVTDLLAELYAFADQLTLRRCQTARWKRFVRCRHIPEILAQYRRDTIQAWDQYCCEGLLPEEMTAETAAGHRLLKEGLSAWLEAIEIAEADPEAEEAAWVALDANRLLITVNHQARELHKTGQDLLQSLDNFVNIWQA